MTSEHELVLLRKVTAAMALGIDVNDLLANAIIGVLANTTITDKVKRIIRDDPPELPKSKPDKRKKTRSYKKSNDSYNCKWCNRSLRKQGVVPHENWCSENPNRRTANTKAKTKSNIGFNQQIEESIQKNKSGWTTPITNHPRPTMPQPNANG